MLNKEIERGLINLRSTNLFESVELKIEQSGSHNILIVEVIERPSLLLRFRLRIDTEYFTQASLDIREENLFGTGTELGAIFTGGIRNQLLAFQLRSNRIFDTFLTYNIRGFYDARDIRTYIDDSASTERKFIRSKSGEYSESHFGGSIGIGAQLEKIGNLMIEGRYQQDKIRGLETFPATDEYSTNISSLRFALSIDSQNKYPFPTTGVAFNGYYETAQRALGGRCWLLENCTLIIRASFL
ncbi:MAG: BamA/TamA family outer membrane protein [Melioribacteraceae bacterium]|nr:BamA/TamA family outer membrane protein [Melioribacteraceae bacterium]